MQSMDHFIAGETEINLKKAIRFTLLLIANAEPHLLGHRVFVAKII